MNKNARVIFEGIKKSPNSVAKFLIFKKNTTKAVIDTRKVKYGTASLFLITATISAFIGPDTKISIKPRISIDLHTATVDVPAYQPKKAEVKRKTDRKSPKMSGLSLVSRKFTVAKNSIKPIKAKIIGRSTDGPIRVRLIESFDGEIFFEKGTFLVGQAKSQGERLQIEFMKAITTANDAFKIKARAVDLSDEGIGVKGSVSWSKAKKFMAQVGLDFASGMADGLKDRSTTDDGQVVEDNSAKNALLNGTSRATMQQATQYMSDIRSEQEKVEVPNEALIGILFEEIE